MARMVTRTVTSTKVNALCADLNAGELFNEEFTLAGKIEDPAKIMRMIAKGYDSDDFRIVQVVDVSYETALRGMTEEKFIKESVIIEQ